MGNFLTPDPTGPAPLEGQDLNRFLQQLIVGITGMDGTMVRPAYQTEPPDIPDAGNVWAAFRYSSRPSDNFPFVAFDQVGLNVGLNYTMHRHEDINVLISFYDLGTNGQADKMLALFRDGLSIPQNLEALTLAGFGFVGITDPVVVPVFLKQLWMYRVDLPFTVRREITRTYSVQSVISASGTLVADDISSTTFNVP